MIGLIGSAIGGVLGAISGGSQQQKENELAQQNFDLQKEQFEYQKFLNDRQFNYQKELNEKMMEREDNAVQRRAKDLEAAGLSKTLAAGSSASAGGMSSGGSQSSSSAPQKAMTGSAISSVINGGANMMKMFGDILHTNTQNQIGQKDLEVKDVQKENIQADTNVKKADEAVKTADAILKNKEATNYEKKLAQNIKESDARIKNMEMNNLYTQEKTKSEQFNQLVGKVYGLPVGATPVQSKLGALGNDIARSIFAPAMLIDEANKYIEKELEPHLPKNKSSKQKHPNNMTSKEYDEYIYNKYSNYKTVY